MDLHLIRHAEAEPKRDDLPDEERALTDKGRAQARRLAAALKALGLSYDLVLASPKRRALETAKPLRALAKGKGYEVEPGLAGPPEPALLERLRGLGLGSVALVGHEPHLGALLAALLGLPGGGERFELGKGGLWALDWPEPPRLRLGLTPRLLRRLAES